MNINTMQAEQVACYIANNYGAQNLEDFLNTLAVALDAKADLLDKDADQPEHLGYCLHSTAQSLWDATASWAARNQR
jgi:hypothetical protein